MLKSKSAVAEWSVVIPKLPASVQNAVAEKLSSHFGFSSEEARETLQNTPIILLDQLRLSDAEKIKELFKGTAEHLMLSRDVSFKKKCFRVLWSKPPAELLPQWLSPEPTPPVAPAAARFEQEPESVPENPPEALSSSELPALPRDAELEARVRAHEARGAELNELIDKKDRNLRFREEALDREKESHAETRRLLSEAQRELEKWVQKEKQAQTVLRQFESEIEKAAEGVQGAVREAEEWKEKAQKLETHVRELETAESAARKLLEGKHQEFESERKGLAETVKKLEAKIGALGNERGKENSRAEAARDQLESQLARLRSEKDSLSREMEGVRRKMAEFDKTRQKAEREMTAALEEKKEALHEAAELRKKRQEFEKNRELVGHLQAQNKQAAEALQELQKTLREKEDGLKRESGFTEALRMRESELLRETESLRQSLADSVHRARFLEAKIQDLESLGAALREEAQNYLAQSREHEQRSGQLQGELQTLNGELAQTRQELAESHDQLRAAGEAIQAREQDLESTRAALNVAGETIRGRDQDLESVRAEREALQQKASELQELCHAYGQQLEDWEKKCAVLTAEHAEAKVRLEEGLGSLSNELQQSREEAQNYLAQNREHEQRSGQLQGELQTLTEELAQERTLFQQRAQEQQSQIENLMAELEKRLVQIGQSEESVRQMEQALAGERETQVRAAQKSAQEQETLKRELEAVRAECETFRMQWTELEGKRAAYVSLIAEWESRCAILELRRQEEKQLSEQALAHISEELKEARAHLDQRNQSMTMLGQTLESRELELGMLREKITGLEESCRAYELKIADGESRSAALEAEHHEEKRQIQEALGKLADDLKQARDDAQTWKDRAQGETLKAEQFQEQSRSQQDDLERINAELESARQESAQIRSDLEALQGELQSVCAQQESLKEKLAVSEQNRGAYEAALADLGRKQEALLSQLEAERKQAEETAGRMSEEAARALEAAWAQSKSTLEDLAAEHAAERQAEASEKERLVKAAKDAKEELRNYSHRFQALEEVKNEFVSLLAAERKRYADMKAEYDRLQNRLEYQISGNPEIYQPAAFEPEETDDARLKRLKLILDMEDKKEKTPPGFAE